MQHISCKAAGLTLALVVVLVGGVQANSSINSSIPAAPRRPSNNLPRLVQAFQHSPNRCKA